MDKIHAYPIPAQTKWQEEPQTEFDVLHGVSSLIIGGLNFKGEYVNVLCLHL